MSELPFSGPPAAKGTVYLVGGGPGDPGLVGLRAAHLMATATFVAYDRLAPMELLKLCRPEAQRVYVGKMPDRHALKQDEINDLLVAMANEGHAVVRWKGGDPFILARGSEEAQSCAVAGVPFEVVPAVTSGVAAPAYAGIPVTHRGLSPGFAVVTGHEDPTKRGVAADEAQGRLDVDYDALAAFPGTLLLYMGMARLREIAAALVDAGRPPDQPVALVRWGSTPRQETLTGTLADIADRAEAVGFANPAIIVVGDVVSLRHEIRWFDTRPLHGRSVLVPRTRQQSSDLSARLRALGAEPVEAPTIAIEPGRDQDRLATAVVEASASSDGRWIVFTSANAVEATWSALTAAGRDARALAGLRIAAVGGGTDAALGRHGLHADLVPERATATALGEALVATGGRASALIPHADIASPALGEVLDGAGWQLEQVEAYRTVAVASLPDGVADRVRAGAVDVVAFSSSSTARNLMHLLGTPLPEATLVVSIGPATSATCRELGLRVDAEADPHDLEGLAAAVVSAVESAPT